MLKRIALFGGSFNPAGVHHRRVAHAVSHMRQPFAFCKLVVTPCGPRGSKPTTNDIEPVHRAVMADKTFRGLPHTEVDHFDLENDVFTRTFDLIQRYRTMADEVWLVVGTDLIVGGAEGASEIQRSWWRGQELWNEARFVVVRRKGYDLSNGDLPPNSIVLEVEGDSVEGSSSQLRQRIFARKDVSGMLVPDVYAYIERYGLYRSSAYSKETSISITDPRAIIYADGRKPEAVELAQRFSEIEAKNEEEANCVIVCGGDGSLLRGVSLYGRLRLPFIGAAAGNRNYLLNAVQSIEDMRSLMANMTAYQLPLLGVEFQSADGVWQTHYAFNDAWVLPLHRGQMIWAEVKVGGRVRIPRLETDVVLLCTPAGSTGFARNLGETPLRPDTHGYNLIGRSVSADLNWKASPLSARSVTEVTAIDTVKRPFIGFVDGREVGVVNAMRVKVSRTRDVELCFDPLHDMSARLEDTTFPKL